MLPSAACAAAGEPEKDHLIVLLLALLSDLLNLSGVVMERSIDWSGGSSDGEKQ